ncbi:coatomer subunit delta [Pancytospora epiphaga]|nr:coatomer subunit delta [Pancytospora epiphaga]
MIISIGAIDMESDKKVFRAAKELSPSRINYYISEFISSALGSDGVLSRDSYDYIYITCGAYKYFIQTTKDAMRKETMSLLRYVEQSSEKDLFDILITIDAVLYGGQGIKLDDIRPIKTMDSQEEAIYNMMMENKNMEIKKREKEHRRVEYNEERINPGKQAVEHKPKKIEQSDSPVLVVIKEKIKAVIDVENFIKESSVSGEVNLVIYKPECQSVQLKIANLKGAFKPSPYLDKLSLKKGILRFEKERGCNKSIPLLKWSDKIAKMPLSIEYWNDEENGKYLTIIECKAKRSLTDVEFRFSKDEVTEIDVEEDMAVRDNAIVWRIGSLAAGESKSGEIRFFGFDSKGIFPANVSFGCGDIESGISIDGATVKGEELKEFEVRRITEVEMFKIVNE